MCFVATAGASAAPRTRRASAASLRRSPRDRAEEDDAPASFRPAAPTAERLASARASAPALAHLHRLPAARCGAADQGPELVPGARCGGEARRAWPAARSGRLHSYGLTKPDLRFHKRRRGCLGLAGTSIPFLAVKMSAASHLRHKKPDRKPVRKRYRELRTKEMMGPW